MDSKEMMADSIRIDNILTSGEVVRFHALPSVENQLVAHHAWGVAFLCDYLYAGQASKELIMEALAHDSGELITGDMPFTVKRDNPKIATMMEEMEEAARFDFFHPPQKLTLLERRILKLADMLEGVRWCTHHERTVVVRGRWNAAILDYIKQHHKLLGVFFIRRVNNAYRSFTGSWLVLEGVDFSIDDEDDGSKPTSAYTNQDQP